MAEKPIGVKISEAAREYSEGHERECEYTWHDLAWAFDDGAAHEKERILKRLNKWADDHWIPSPTVDDSFWQNDLIRSLRATIIEGEK